MQIIENWLNKPVFFLYCCIILKTNYWRTGIMKKETTIDKRVFKKSPEELQLYMYFKKRGFKIENKKGKGSYKRRPKHNLEMC